MTINEPDFWVVNLFGKTARHGVDSGPTFDCRMPIFANSDKLQEAETKKIMTVEFGLELEFFKSKSATPHEDPVLQTKETTANALDIGESNYAVFTYGTPEKPLAVMRKHGEETHIFMV